MLFKKNKAIEFKSPVKGKVVKIEDVPDQVFSQKILGDGIAVDPSDGKFYSPINGEIITVFPHAYGIKHRSGINVLLHVGIDTVNLKGKGFTIKCAVGQKVAAGDLLVECDLPALKKATPSMISPIVFIPDSMGNKTLSFTTAKTVNVGDTLVIAN